MEKFGFIIKDKDSYYKRLAAGGRTYRSVMTQAIKKVVKGQENMGFEEAWEYVKKEGSINDKIEVVLLYQKVTKKRKFSIKRFLS